MTISNAKDFWAGVIYVAVGLAAIVIARDYTMGTATKMGPAYFPTALGGFLAVIGVVSILRSFVSKSEPIGKFTVKGTLYVCGSTVLFGLLLRGAGVVVSLVVLVLVSAYASSKFRIGTTALLAVALTVGSVLIFVKGLGIPLPLFGSWFGE